MLCPPHSDNRLLRRGVLAHAAGPVGVRARRLDNPSVAASIALVTDAAQPGSVLARSLEQKDIDSYRRFE